MKTDIFWILQFYLEKFEKKDGEGWVITYGDSYLGFGPYLAGQPLQGVSRAMKLDIWNSRIAGLYK